MIGSPQKLGQWKTEGGLKLSYAGDSIWQADCVMGKEDFPIKYPFEVSRRGSLRTLPIMVWLPHSLLVISL